MLKDQIELLYALNEHGVEYLVVGGFAVNLHNVPQTTKDLDLLVGTSGTSPERVYASLAAFGGVAIDDFRRPDEFFQIGVAPDKVDTLPSISGIDFQDAWSRRISVEVDENVLATLVSRDDLIHDKEISGRPQDVAHVAKMRAVERVRSQQRETQAYPMNAQWN